MDGAVGGCSSAGGLEERGFSSAGSMSGGGLDDLFRNSGARSLNSRMTASASDEGVRSIESRVAEPWRVVSLGDSLIGGGRGGSLGEPWRDTSLDGGRGDRRGSCGRD